jgi:hypothetical protein
MSPSASINARSTNPQSIVITNAAYHPGSARVADRRAFCRPCANSLAIYHDATTDHDGHVGFQPQNSLVFRRVRRAVVKGHYEEIKTLPVECDGWNVRVRRTCRAAPQRSVDVNGSVLRTERRAVGNNARNAERNPVRKNVRHKMCVTACAADVRRDVRGRDGRLILDRVSSVDRQVVRRHLIRRLIRNSASVGGLILAALGIGAVGYHLLDGLSWLDSTLNAAMILTGMGPVSPITSPAAKVFAIVYSLFSGVFFLTMVAVLLAPALHHFVHRIHLELSEKESQHAKHHPPNGPSAA